MTTISGKIFIIIFFLFLPYPITAVYCLLSLLSLLFSILRFHFILFFSIFSLITLLFGLFFMLFRLVICFFSLFLVLFLYIYIYFSSIFHHFPINLFFLIDIIYISVSDYIYNKIPNSIYK